MNPLRSSNRKLIMLLVEKVKGLSFKRFGCLYETMPKEEKVRFIKYIAVGILNTLNGFFLFSSFIFLGLHYSLASLLATVLGVMFNFKTYGSLVFKSSSNRLIFKFVAVYVFTYFLGLLFLKFFAMIAVSMYVAGLILLLPFSFLTYVLLNRYVFIAKK